MISEFQQYIEQGGELMKLGIGIVWFLVNVIIQSFDATEIMTLISATLLSIWTLMQILEKWTKSDIFPGTNGDD